MMNHDEYEICKRRGHEPSGLSTTIGYETWEHCRFCNVQYRFGEPRLIERTDEAGSWSPKIAEAGVGGVS